MTEQESVTPSGDRAGDRRQQDRRSDERRRDDRRTPPPPWRKPAAYVAYGSVGALVLVLMLRSLGSDDPQPIDAATETELLGEPPPEPAVDASGAREAFTTGQYERLLTEGQNAVGQMVRTELYCGSVAPIATRDVQAAGGSLAALVDAEGRVAGAECRWGREGRTSDFLLIVPPGLAEEFARAPEVELNFVRRRVIQANVEWLGRSEPLALRTAGVLREIRR